ncbi:MAG: Pr6Pr family membrane protein [Methylocella sp.]
MVTAGLTPPEAAPSSDIQRFFAGVLAAMAWFGLGVEIILGLSNSVSKNSSIAAYLVNYFSLFSIQTNLLVALVLTLACARPQAETLLLRPRVQSALVVYIIVVGVVFELLLRGPKSRGMQFVSDGVLHDAIPILYVLYWLVFTSKGRLTWGDPALWLLYPLLFFVYTIARGAVFGIYPYSFIDVTKLGYPGVFINALVFLGVFFALGLVLTAIDRALGKRRSRRRNEVGGASAA